MDRNEMHVVFRTLGQQMGLQQVRGILPESIDVYLNVAQSELVREIVKINLANKRDEKISQMDNPLHSINSISNLIKTSVLKTSSLYPHDNSTLTINKIEISKHVIPNRIEDNMIITSIVITNKPGGQPYKCRLIELQSIESTLSDYCNGVSQDCPIAAVSDRNFIIYCIGSLYSLTINYIKNPSRITEDSDCELDEYLHTEVVEKAVNKFLISIRNTSQPQTQQ